MTLHCSTEGKHRSDTFPDGSTGSLQLASEWGEVIGAFILVSLAGWFLFQAQSLSGNIGTSIGPATFPIGISLLLIVASLALLGSTLKRLLADKKKLRIEVRRPLAIACSMVLLCTFPYAMSKFGYYPTMAVWLFTFAWIANVQKPLRLIGVVASFLLFSKLIFEILLGTPLS